jgi:hypothetical protein
MLEQKLLEEINRFKSINKNAKSLYVISEQEIPAAPEAPADDLGAELPAPPTDAAAPDVAPAETLDAPAMEGETEEVDVTDLVNMTKNIKNELEMSKAEQGGVMQQMDAVFSKLDDLEAKLGNMDAVIAKIDQLGAKIDDVKPQTPQEKLEMRSLDSYPFNEKPQEFFAHKQDEMKASGKNEYVLSKSDIENYSKEELSSSFNPYKDEEQQPRF